LGHPESIAEKTGMVTVADFRQADIASGGEGAPITSSAMALIFGQKDTNRLLINIGGIANYFLIAGKRRNNYIKARDCGPGNSLLDLAANKYFGKKFDRGGKLASKGKISHRLLSMMLSDSFLKGKFGPSTGRERFGQKFLGKVEKNANKLKLDKYDIMASLGELTIVSITKMIRSLITKYEIFEIDFFGGGARNTFLKKRLQFHLPDVNLFSVDRYGFNPDYLEAVCFAVMGVMTLHSNVSGMGYVTGAEKNTICGRIIQPSPDKR
jgi:anhydro-N-acetylmuramic acid kinase